MSRFIIDTDLEVKDPETGWRLNLKGSEVYWQEISSTFERVLEVQFFNPETHEMVKKHVDLRFTEEALKMGALKEVCV